MVIKRFLPGPGNSNIGFRYYIGIISGYFISGLRSRQKTQPLGNRLKNTEFLKTINFTNKAIRKMDHNLEYPWTLYVTKQRTVQGFEKSIKEWEDRLEKIQVFNTAESFWCVYNNIRLPSEMKNERGDYYLFKDEILPEWEHPRNVGGGSILLNFDPFKADEVWLRVQLEVIGNNFPRLDVVCGLELAIRKNRYKIAVWVDNSKTTIVRELAEELKKIIHVISVEFRRHETGDKLEFTIK